MKVLVAPDKFKGSLSAAEVAENIATGLTKARPGAQIEIVPMADGGEGTAEVLCEALGGRWIDCPAADPMGRTVDARYAYVDKRNLAIIETSETAGMHRVSPRNYDPLKGTTFGVGHMILDAARRGASEIIVGLGGTATNDGGFGMARALGYRFFEELNKHELRSGVGLLRHVHLFEEPRKLVLPPIIAAADVSNPLLGKDGATRVFGPQKGISPENLNILERGLARLADVVKKQCRIDFRNEPGAGAAGGLGFGLMSFAGAKIRPGFGVVARAVDLETKMKGFDIVITGEGSLDEQTLRGKTPAGVAQLARKLGKPVYAIVGQASEDQGVRELFHKVVELRSAAMTAEESMTRTGTLLQERAGDLFKTLSL